jgi:hypothetical protein
MVAPGRPFVHLFIPSHSISQALAGEAVDSKLLGVSLLMFDAREFT